MGEEIIVRHCSPTLAGLKTGALFNCKYESKQELYAWMRGLNRKLSRKGLRVIPLRFRGDRALIYVYRPKKLKRDMARADVAQLLRQNGYKETTPEYCIAHLKERLGAEQDFPHEIGLFLGYPTEDVKGFMEQGGRASKYVGHWCVFGDAEKAKQTFSLYDKCATVYMQRFKSGSDLERLTVGT